MTAEYVCPATSNSTRKTMAEGLANLFTVVLNNRSLPAQQNFTGANTTKNLNNRILPAQIPQKI